jgi:hypothetical protein
VNQVSTPLAGRTGWGHVKVSSTGQDLKRALPAEGEHLQRRNGSIRFQGNSGTYLPNYKSHIQQRRIWLLSFNNSDIIKSRRFIGWPYWPTWNWKIMVRIGGRETQCLDEI